MLSGGGKRTLGMNNSRMISGALSGQTPAPDPGGYIAFAEIGAALWRRKWTVLAASLGGLALGLAAGWLQRPVYRAAGAIEIQIPNDDYLNRRQLDPSVKPGPILMEQFLQTELRLLQSDTLFREVVTTLSLASHPEFNRPPGLLSRGMQRSSPVSPTATGQAQGPLLDEFRDRVEVRMIGQTQIAEVSFEAGDPELAATVVNRLIDRYRRQSLRRRAATAGETADLLAGQLTELENGLENTQGRLRSFIARERVVGSLDRETIAEAKMRQLAGAETGAQEARIAEQSRLDAGGLAGPVTIEPLETDALARYRLKLTELRQKKAELSETLKPAHFKIKQVQAEIEEVERSLQYEQTGLMGRARGRLDAATRREKSLQRRMDEQSSLVAQQAAAAMRYGSLKHEMDTYQQLRDNMLQKVKEARLAAGVLASSIQVVDPASIPYRPVRPKKLLLAGAGALGGMLLGLLMALWPSGKTEAVEKNRWPVDHRQMGPVVPVWSIPHLTSAGDQSVPLLFGPGRFADSAPAGAAESFRGIARALWPAEAAWWPRVVSVTSAHHLEGKTTVACNLAVTAAREGRRVLLVDADYLNPQLHSIFEIKGGPGFLTLLARRTGSLLSELKQSGGGTGIYVLPLGPPPVAPLSPDRLLGLLADLKTEFDIIILDMPPLLASDEVPRLIRSTDGAIIVTEAGEAPIEAATRMLIENGAKVLGSVINRAVPDSARLSPRRIA